MKLELAIMAGPESKAWLAELTQVVDRLEALAARIPGGNSEAAEIADPDAAGDDDEEFAPAEKKRRIKKATEPAFEDESGDEPEAEEEEEDFSAPPAKKNSKPKKVTLDDVNDACKAKARALGGASGVPAVRALLKKHFKVDTVTKLKPEQYAKVVELMSVEE